MLLAFCKLGMRRERGHPLRLATPAFFFATLLVALAIPTSARADSIIYDLTVPNSVMSSYPDPYGKVTVTWVSTTSATVKFEAASTGGYYYLFGDGSSMAVNVNASSFKVTDIAASGGNYGGDLKTTTDGNVSDFGTFNLRFKNKGGAENAFLTGSFTLTNKSGTWSDAAHVLAANGDDYFAAAHIFVYSNANYTGGAIDTGFVGDGDDNTPTETPEPASIAVVGIGLACMMGHGWRRRRQGAARN